MDTDGSNIEATTAIKANNNCINVNSNHNNADEFENSGKNNIYSLK